MDAFPVGRIRIYQFSILLLIAAVRSVSAGAGDVSPEMVSISGGEYTSLADANKNIPSKQYRVDDFLIGKHEVTFEEFNRFCDETGYYKKRYTINRPMLYTRPDSVSSPDWNRLPVVKVCWLDAMAYCLWLEEKTGKPYRLPTQIEWEYACTAGKGIHHSAPQDLGKIAWYKANSPEGDLVHSVGSKSPYPDDLYDMLGNVWEWCLDGTQDDDYPEPLREWERIRRRVSCMDMDRTSHELSAISSIFSGRKALRGGAYNAHAERLVISYRMFYPLNYTDTRAGFRLALSEGPSRLGQEENESRLDRP